MGVSTPPAAPAAPPRPVLARVIQGLVALAVSAFALWFSFKDVDLGPLFARLGDSDLGVLTLYALAQLVIHAVRVVRWGILVRPLGPVSWRAVFSAASVGIPASMFLPLRLGELVRPAMLSRAGVPFASAMASVVTERLADGLTNVGLFFVLLTWMPPTAALPDKVRLMAELALYGFGGACLALVLMVWSRDRTERLVGAFLRPRWPRLAERFTQLFGVFVQGLRPLMAPRRLLAFVALTVVYWAINGGVTTILARSYGLDVPWVAGPFAIVLVVFAVTLPAGPAFAGTLQLGFLLGLRPFGVTDDQAALVAISVHLIQIGSQAMLIGVGFLAAEPGQRHVPVTAPPGADAADDAR